MCVYVLLYEEKKTIFRFFNQHFERIPQVLEELVTSEETIRRHEFPVVGVEGIRQDELGTFTGIVIEGKVIAVAVCVKQTRKKMSSN